MTRIVRFHEVGGPDVLRIDDLDLAPPGPGEVQIDVRALGLNRAEAMFRQGQYLEQPNLPARIGYEAAGTVTAVGAGVDAVRVGQRVATIPGFSMNSHGVHAARIVVPAAIVVPTPDAISDNEAAAVWMQYLTAWGALIHVAKLQAGEAILIPAASSSVGLAAIQIANVVGATPIALTRTSRKVAELKQHGAAHVVVTGEQDLVAEVKRITGNAPPRVAFDPVGGPTVAQLAETLAFGGVLLIYGALSPEPTPFPLMPMLGKSLSMRGYTLYEVAPIAETLKRGIEWVLKGLSEGKLKPVIGKTFPFEKIADAHRYLESNEQVGKIVVTV